MIVKRDGSRSGEVGGDGGSAGGDPPRQAAGDRGRRQDADRRGRIRGGEGVAGAASRADGDHAIEVIAARARIQVRACGLQDHVRSGVQVEAGVNVDFIDLRRILDGEDVSGGRGLRRDEEFPVAARSSARAARAQVHAKVGARAAVARASPSPAGRSSEGEGTGSAARDVGAAAGGAARARIQRHGAARARRGAGAAAGAARAAVNAKSVGGVLTVGGQHRGRLRVGGQAVGEAPGVLRGVTGRAGLVVLAVTAYGRAGAAGNRARGGLGRIIGPHAAPLPSLTTASSPGLRGGRETAPLAHANGDCRKERSGEGTAVDLLPASNPRRGG